MGQGDCGGFGSGRIGGHVRALTSVSTPLEPRRTDMEHGPDREGGAVTDGLNHGEEPPSIQKDFLLVSQAQLRSLLDHWVTPWRHP